METEVSGSGPSGKRLMIREMVLENFKSYAGRQPVGPFHKCFSSVVGPNGSGKSNVIDAMLFVFGKRAKQLRLNKVSELIHNSSNHRNLEMAKVSVLFQEITDTGEETFDVVPDSEFVVSRTAHRNNTSNYYINERKSNFGEVTDLLKKKGIDLNNNRFLILQGEVEQISMMKPKAQTPHETGLLEYLEDLIGTDKYVERIEAGAKSLEEMNEKRQSMVQRLKFVERERDSLEDSRTAAEAYLEKEKECAATKCKAYQMHIKDGEKHIGTLSSGIGELRGKLEYEQNKKKTNSADLKESESKVKAEQKVVAEIQRALEKTDAGLQEYERKDIKLREDIKHLKAKLKKLDEKLAKDGALAEETAGKADEAEADGPRLEQKAEALSKKLKAKETELEKMRESTMGEVEGYQKALQKVRAELAPWERQMAEVQSKKDVAVAEKDLLLKKQRDAEQRLQAAKKGVAGATETAKKKREEIEDMRRAAGTHREEATRARIDSEAASREVEKLESGMREVRVRLEKRRNDNNAQRSQSAIMGALAAAKASGSIAGIHGRLGDLGAIDKQYDVAVSTACGALDNVVVSDAVAAQRCVELVRREKLGIVTCLMLDKQRHLVNAAAERVSPPEGVKRLYDLIKVEDEAIRVAFYYALGNTLVAKDLDQAARIAYSGDRRWSRVVTLQGEMINESGTMSGGGGKPRGGRMCVGRAAPRSVDAKQAAAELASSEADFESSKQALGAARERAAAAAAAAAEAEKALADLEVAIPKTELEVHAQQQRAADLKQCLADLESATTVAAEDARRLKALESSISAAEKELQPLKKSAAGLQARAGELQQQIEDAGGEPLKKAKTVVASLQEEISSTEEEAARRKVEAQAARKQVDKLRKGCTKAQQDKEQAAADLQKQDAAFMELEEAALKVGLDKQRTETLLRSKNAELSVLQEQYSTKKNEVNVIRMVEVELENKITDLEVKLGFESKTRESNLRRLEDGRRKLAQMLGTEDLPPLLADEELDRERLSDVNFRVTILEEDLTRMNPDMSAIEAYRKKEADYAAKAKELEEATAEREGVRRGYEELKKRRLDEFMAGFGIISMKLKEMYQMITLGGDAELELVDSLDPFSEGIVFSVRPPKKSWKNIANLSGGEKTLSSLSLVFALHHFKPTPLYVMDEIDAALDFKNVSIVAHYIKERTKNAQFVIISLRNNMFELADRLVGIYKTDNATKSVAINPGEFAVGNHSSANFQVALANA